MLVKEGLFYVDTNKDTHFTDALTAGASEYENLVVTGTGRLRTFITSVRMRAATNHAFTLAFYSKDGTFGGTQTANPHRALAATPYESLLIDYWPFASADAWIAGPVLGSADTVNVTNSTEFVYSVTGLKIPYVDEDGTGELHLGLHNLDKRTKLALGNTNLPSGVSQQYIQIRFGLIGAAEG